jgi:hypothetical protein
LCLFLFTGVSLLLVNIAQGILTAGLLPICKERLWIDSLTTGSSVWVLGALAESILVAHFFFMETRDSERMLHLAINKQVPDEHALGGSVTSRDGIQDEQSQSLEAIDEEEQERDESEHLPPRTRFLDYPATPNPRSVDAPGPRLERRAALGRLTESVLQKQTESWRRKAITNLDKGCLIVFPVTYIIFLIVMFATNDQWA